MPVILGEKCYDFPMVATHGVGECLTSRTADLTLNPCDGSVAQQWQKVMKVGRDGGMQRPGGYVVKIPSPA